jgi:hypothetical protein
LQGGRSDARGGHEVARYARVVKRRVDGRGRIEIRDVTKDALRAAALIEIIVNERRLHLTAAKRKLENPVL